MFTKSDSKKNVRIHLKNGVNIIDKKTTYIDKNVEIDKTATILPGCVIMENVKIGKNATVGPYSYLRPGTIVGENCKVGAFVEVKNSKIDNNSKVPHLSYVGDASIGKNSNIGAGTIFANYDGVNKHKTTVGSNVKIGSKNVLVAPVKIDDDVYTGAGTVIRENVPKGVLAVLDSKLRIIKGWVRKNR